MNFPLIRTISFNIIDVIIFIFLNRRQSDVMPTSDLLIEEHCALGN